jgi:hypothetical protein
LSELLQDGIQIGDTPVLGDLAVANTHGVDGFELDGSACRRDAEKVAEMGAVIDLVGRDQVGLDRLPTDLRAEVGERFAQPRVENADTRLVRSRSGLWCVVDEVFGKQFVEQGEIPFAVDFLGVSPNDGLGPSAGPSGAARSPNFYC